MNPFLNFLVGMVAGLLFGLMVAWGILTGWWLIIGVLAILIGIFAPTPFRGMFVFTMLGFLIAFVLSGGFEVMGI